MRVVYMVSSEYGLRCVKESLKCPESCPVGIVTTPESFILRYGKGSEKKMTNRVYQSLIKFTSEKNIPLYVIDKMNSRETVNTVTMMNPQLIIVSGWYHIIGKEILGIPEKGVIALHSSLLPKYKGGAPLVWQIINGEKTAGITLFFMDEGMDSGDIIEQAEIEIQDDDTIASLYERVGNKGIELLIRNIPLISRNKAQRIKQDTSSESIFPQRKPDDGHINWDDTAVNIYNFVRAQTRPYPGAFSEYKGIRMKIWSCSVISSGDCEAAPGRIISINDDGSFNVAVNEGGKMLKITDYSFDTDQAEMNMSSDEVLR